MKREGERPRRTANVNGTQLVWPDQLAARNRLYQRKGKQTAAAPLSILISILISISISILILISILVSTWYINIYINI